MIKFIDFLWIYINLSYVVQNFQNEQLSIKFVPRNKLFFILKIAKFFIFFVTKFFFSFLKKTFYFTNFYKFAFIKFFFIINYLKFSKKLIWVF
uniref:Nad5_i n=1 Tax=Oxytricha trifallax TaxID=1172189 RepID=G9HRD0_9SPIT|nr:nad5_i [Oxytricha trifallax]